jgi:hypothetical protein
VREQTDSVELKTSPDAWYDLWHTHVDWDGLGNSDAEFRKQSLAKLFRLFESLLEQAQRLPGPSNVWLLYVPGNSEDDSVYVHTPNPNGTPFPYEFEGVSWGVQPPQALAQFLRPEHEVGSSTYNGEMFWVRVRNAT